VGGANAAESVEGGGRVSLTIGSLFSGVGGLELGLEWAALGPVVWQCEIDPFCRAVLAKHWPNATRYEDVTIEREWPRVDIICGGFPCQDISTAGRGVGLDGARSGLWYTYLRIVRQIRPDSLSWRTSQLCLEGGLESYSEDWPRSGTMRNGTCYPLPLSAQIMRESACSSLPTPTATDSKRWPVSQYYAHKPMTVGSADSLPQFVARSCGADRCRLNPAYVEALMGFPEGWTDDRLSVDSKPSVTPSSHNARKSSAKSSNK
jgi:hypothetical protein